MPEPSPTTSVAAQVLSEHTRLVIPGQPQWIEPTVDFLRAKAVQCGVCHESRAAKLLVALLEALSNAVVHGNLEISSELKEHGDDAFARALAERAADPVVGARVVEIVVDYDGEACRWIITDEGRGFDVERVLRRCLSDDPEVMLASGRGILMMHSFLDGVQYEQGGRRQILTLQRPSGMEKRRQARLPLNEAVRVAPRRADGSPDLAASRTAVSSDLSERGIALIQGGLVAGQRIYVGIPSGGETVYVPAQVRHCRTLAEGCVQLGCEFELAPPSASATPESAEQLDLVQQAILDLLARRRAAVLPADDRRAHPRVTFNQVVTVVSPGLEPPVSGYARDLSKGGMALITRAELPPSVVIATLPRDAAVPLRIRARVVRCNRIQEGYYDVGLQFLSLAAGSDAER